MRLDALATWCDRVGIPRTAILLAVAVVAGAGSGIIIGGVERLCHCEILS